MDTTSRASESKAVVGGAALALAGCAALSLTVGSAIWTLVPSSDAGPTALWLIGWLLLFSATILGGCAAVRVLGDVASRRRPALIEIVLVVATAAAIVGTVYAYPLFGSGGASAPG